MKVLTLGTFDTLHYGHLRLLKRCKQYGEVWIGLNTNEFIVKYKGKPPIMSYEERRESLELVGYNNILPNNQEDGTIKDVFLKICPDLIVIGSDWLRKPYLPQIGLTPDYLETFDCSLLFVPYTQKISTTEIKKRCKLNL